MGFKMEWNGDRIQEWAKQRGDERLAGNAAEIEHALGSVTCPEHGNRANVERVQIPGGWSLQLVDPCCGKLQDAFERANAREVRRIARTQ